MGSLNDEQQRFVGHIHKDSLHLLDLINDLLDLSKIEAGRLMLHREAFDAGYVVREAIDTVAAAAKGKNVSIDAVSGPALAPVPEPAPWGLLLCGLRALPYHWN